jgi:hypothetical protein
MEKIVPCYAKPAKPAKKPTNKTKPARKLRVTTRHMREMIHAMDMNQANTKTSVEIGALNDLIVALSQQVAQISSELTATWIPFRVYLLYFHNTALERRS